MEIKNILAKLFKMRESKLKTIDELFFHEDDYLQVEIIPKENFFQKSKNLNETKYNFSQLGITNISSRESAKMPTVNLEIAKDHMIFIIEKYALVKFNKIYSGYGSSTNVIQKKTIAYGFEDYAILFNHNNMIVENIWLLFSPKLKMPFHNYGNITKTLTSIGKLWNFILIDWNEEVIVDLKTEERIIHYLKSI